MSSNFHFCHWVNLSIEDLAYLFRRTSHWAQSTYIAHFYLKTLSKVKHLPRSLPELIRVFGIHKKSAVLILQNVYSTSFGIPVDRHLASAFGNLGWVSNTASTHNELQISLMVECWIPSSEWALANDVIAGIRQLWQSSATKPQFLTFLEERCSEQERLLLLTLCQDPQ
jgi:endonuclease III